MGLRMWNENEGAVRLGVVRVGHLLLLRARDGCSPLLGRRPEVGPLKKPPGPAGTQPALKRIRQQLLLLKQERWLRGLCVSPDQNTPIKRDQEPGQVDCRCERELNFLIYLTKM